MYWLEQHMIQKVLEGVIGNPTEGLPTMAMSFRPLNRDHYSLYVTVIGQFFYIGDVVSYVKHWLQFCGKGEWTTVKLHKVAEVAERLRREKKLRRNWFTACPSITLSVRWTSEDGRMRWGLYMLSSHVDSRTRWRKTRYLISEILSFGRTCIQLPVNSLLAVQLSNALLQEAVGPRLVRRV